MNRNLVARGLGVFGIFLGLAEVLVPRRVARLAGAEGHEKIVRGFGAREIASGIPLLVARQPAPWLWARVVGDLLDGGLLGAGLADPAKRKRALVATLVVAPVVALDLIYAIKGKGKAQEHTLPLEGAAVNDTDQRPLAQGAI